MNVTDITCRLFYFFSFSLNCVVRLVSPQTGTHTHRSAAIVLGVALVGFNAAVILEGLSFITLSLRPSTTIKNNSNNGQITKSDAPLQETHDSKLESVPSLAATAIEQKPSASLWSRVRFPQNFSTLRHAQWMLNYSLFVAACAPFLVGFMRYHYVLPDLWPLIWNDPFWLELMDGFKEGAVSDSSTMTSWRAVWDIMDTTVNAAMTFWSLRVWIRKMEEGKEDNDEK